MTPSLIGALGPFAVLVVIALWFAVLVTALAMPFAMISVARSLRNISRQLERMNPPEPSRGGLFPNATVRRPPPEPAPSMGHQLLR